MLSSILVPLDGSTFGEHALPVAASIARRSGASLQILQVNAQPARRGIGLAPSKEEVRREERAYLDCVLDRLARVAGVQATARLLDGPVAEAIQEYACGQGVDLVILTTHGRGPLSRLWLGSVADQLVQRLPVPLLLVRPQSGTPDLARERCPHQFLVALDGSESGEEMLQTAADLGAGLNAGLTLLHVIEPLPTDLQVLAVASLTVPEELRDEAHAYLERLAGPLRARKLNVQTRVVTHPHPATAVLEEAQAHRCDLIAVHTRGRRGLPRLFLGSVADKVVRGAAGMVLVDRRPNA